MIETQFLAKESVQTGSPHQRRALSHSRNLPQLIVAVQEIATSVMHGVHGRRRAGTGETFWQFRPFVMGEATGAIDWRRSARDDRIYVREREWESAHTVWLWIDRSPSMAYISSLALTSKIDRALVLGLALADLLVRGGERVGLLGLTRPLAARNIVERFGECLMDDEQRRTDAPDELPNVEPLPARAQVVLLGDFLSPAAEVAAKIAHLSSRGARGHVVMIADPVEESFPFEGHAEFYDADGSARFRVGEAASFRDAYVARLAAHRDEIRHACDAHGWSFTIHRTDKPATEALLALRMRFENSDRGGAC